MSVRLSTHARSHTQPHTQPHGRARRVGAAALLGAFALTGVVPAVLVPASGHVAISPSQAPAGAAQLFEFAFSHGCGASPTTEVTVQVPEQVLSVTPQRNPGWDVEVTRTALETPVEGAHGATLTDRVSAVTFTADEPLADGVRDVLGLYFTPDADLAGETLAFPVVQTCTEGANDWTEIAAEGVDPHSLESPAPLLTVTASEGDAGHGDHGEHENAEAEAAEAASSGSAWGVAGLLAGLAGLAAGASALVLGRRKI